MGYNKMCQSCKYECKQFAFAEILSCRKTKEEQEEKERQAKLKAKERRQKK